MVIEFIFNLLETTQVRTIGGRGGGFQDRGRVARKLSGQGEWSPGQGEEESMCGHQDRGRITRKVCVVIGTGGVVIKTGCVVIRTGGVVSRVI